MKLRWSLGLLSAVAIAIGIFGHFTYEEYKEYGVGYPFMSLLMMYLAGWMILMAIAIAIRFRKYF